MSIVPSPARSITPDGSKDLLSTGSENWRVRVPASRSISAKLDNVGGMASAIYLVPTENAPSVNTVVSIGFGDIARSSTRLDVKVMNVSSLLEAKFSIALIAVTSFGISLNLCTRSFEETRLCPPVSWYDRVTFVELVMLSSTGENDK